MANQQTRQFQALARKNGIHKAAFFAVVSYSGKGKKPDVDVGSHEHGGGAFSAERAARHAQRRQFEASKAAQQRQPYRRDRDS